MTKQIPLIECWDFVGTTPEKFDGEKRYISTGALDCDHVNEADVEMVTFENRPSRANLAVATGDILFAKMASTEKTFVVDEVASEDIYSTGFCAVRADITKILPKCLYYFLASSLFLDQKDKNASGATQKAITNAGLAKIIINLPPLDEQRTFVAQMDLLCEAITARREQLTKLDELVKSRFIELFGDPEHNEKTIPTLPMTELCEIIDGDRGANYPKQEEFSDNGFCLFLNAKNVTANGFSFENCMFITAEKDKLLRKGKLSRGDVVLTTRGTIGNLAFYDGAVPYEHIRINSGMVILRMKRERITERFFIEQFKMQLASIKEKIASGSAQPQLPISTMNKIVMLVPDVELQHRFAAFVEQTDKSKLAIRQSLDKLELLKKSLMQEYFG